MLVLAVADVHGDFEAYQWLVESVNNYPGSNWTVARLIYYNAVFLCIFSYRISPRDLPLLFPWKNTLRHLYQGGLLISDGQARAGGTNGRSQ
jgi:hypothetical protein